jgi:hypothetical protein
MEITFTCKDANVARYCQDKFGQAWRERLRDAQHYPDEDKDLQEQMVRVLTAEAREQEWYDYELVGQPAPNGVQKRKLILNEDGTPRLLIPQVEINR